MLDTIKDAAAQADCERKLRAHCDAAHASLRAAINAGSPNVAALKRIAWEIDAMVEGLS